MHHSAVGSIEGISTFSEQDVFLFRQGNLFRAYENLGAHLLSVDGRRGTRFSVWAPNAARVTVMGDFNDWDTARHALLPRADDSGIWEGFLPGVGSGALYKYCIYPRGGGPALQK